MASDERRPAVAHGHAVEMTAIIRPQRRHKLRPPARHETVLRIQRAKAREQRIDEPEPLVAPRQLVNVDVSGKVTFSRNEARIADSLRLQPFADGRHVPEFNDFAIRADGQPSPALREPHRSRKRLEVRVELRGRVSSHDHDISGLIRRDKQGHTQLGQNPRDGICRLAAQPRLVRIENISRLWRVTGNERGPLGRAH